MNKITLTIPGKPQGKKAPQWSKHGTYMPKQTVNYETYIKQLFSISFPDFKPLDCCLTMRIEIYLLVPKSVSRKKRAMMLSGEIRPGVKPDCSNVLKSIEDALQGLAFRNDSQVVSLQADKWYSERPEVKVDISEEVEEEIKVGGTD